MAFHTARICLRYLPVLSPLRACCAGLLCACAGQPTCSTPAVVTRAQYELRVLYSLSVLQSAQSTAVKAVLFVQSVNFAELSRARYCSNTAVFSVELTVRTEVRHHHRRRRSVLFVDAVAARFSPRIDTGSVRRQPTTSLVSRARSPGA